MVFKTDWDIEKYKTKFESDEHWEMKRDFMLAHKEKFAEEKLICLAQAFVNVELLRCKYPDAVMKQVFSLSKDVAEKYRQTRKSKLQRTFVTASDAANAKVSGAKKVRKTF